MTSKLVLTPQSSGIIDRKFSRDLIVVVSLLYLRVTIFSLPKRRTFFDNDYYQPYKLFCKGGKTFLDICWT